MCIPDKKKYSLISFCIENNKHILIEKPLILSNLTYFKQFEKRANAKNLFIYVAYNHRFEPNFVNIKKFLSAQTIGDIYSCRIFYGNGTSKLVKNSIWRDSGDGVLSDIGSHLIDLLFFWFGLNKINFKIIKSIKHENKSPDHVIIGSKKTTPFYELEMTLCSWKNEFKLDIFGSKSSVHINNLCKWGDSKMVFRKRVFPSGIPYEKHFVAKYGDKTWKKEYDYFKKMIKIGKKTSFEKDILIQKTLNFI